MSLKRRLAVFSSSVTIRGVHSGHWIDFSLGVSGWFEIGFCVHIGFYIKVNHF